MIFYLLLTTLVLLISFLHFINNKRANHWKKYGIPFDSGTLGLGYLPEFVTGNRPLHEIFDDLYKKYPDVPLIATNNVYATTLMVKDPEIIQQILAGDFNTFSHRGFDANGDVDLLADNVLFMNGVRWKLTRQKMTPLFTSSKLRNMYYIINRSAEDFIQYMKTNNIKKEDVFDNLSSFCSASISASIFGIGTESTMKSPLLDMARKVSTPTRTLLAKFALANFSNRLFNVLKISFFSEYENLFIGAIKQVFEARKNSKGTKHDFADLCIGVQENGTMKDATTGYEIEPTDELLSAQAFFFYIAGVEPSATAMFFTLFELAKNSEILQRVHEEVDDVFEHNDGVISHDHIIKMEYLDRVMDEAMRIHPPIGIITRKTTDNAIIPEGNIPVDKDVMVQIPVYSIHHDPKYYPNPEVFDPDRFTPEAKQQRPKYTFMAFGEGNRMCLGLRFARLQVKIGLVHLLRHFTVKTEHVNTKVKYLKTPLQVRATNIDFEFIERL